MNNKNELIEDPQLKLFIQSPSQCVIDLTNGFSFIKASKGYYCGQSNNLVKQQEITFNLDDKNQQKKLTKFVKKFDQWHFKCPTRRSNQIYVIAGARNIYIENNQPNVIEFICEVKKHLQLEDAPDLLLGSKEYANYIISIQNKIPKALLEYKNKTHRIPINDYDVLLKALQKFFPHIKSINYKKIMEKYNDLANHDIPDEDENSTKGLAIHVQKKN